MTVMKVLSHTIEINCECLAETSQELAAVRIITTICNH